MNQSGRWWLRVSVGVAAVLLPVVPMQAVVPDGPGGGITIRQEVREDKGDFRFTADLYATNREDAEPYWGYLTASKELLMVPNVGRIVFGLALVTPDGKPVVEARWSPDATLPYKRWHPMARLHGRWVLRYSLTDSRPGAKTLYFAGKIKGGKGTYVKLLFLTVGSRKEIRQSDGLQFMVYRLRTPGDALNPRTLADSQLAMGAGGRPLIGPGVRGQVASSESGDQDIKPAVQGRTERSPDGERIASSVIEHNTSEACGGSSLLHPLRGYPTPAATAPGTAARTERSTPSELPEAIAGAPQATASAPPVPTGVPYVTVGTPKVTIGTPKVTVSTRIEVLAPSGAAYPGVTPLRPSGTPSRASSIRPGGISRPAGTRERRPVSPRVERARAIWARRTGRTLGVSSRARQRTIRSSRPRSERRMTALSLKRRREELPSAFRSWDRGSARRG
jgi:hypothetical protein